MRTFISYSHEDEPLRLELDKHLSLLKRAGLLDVWTDHKIMPGSAFSVEIDQALQQAELVLLLVSASFLASDFCYRIELAQALDTARAGRTRVVPIILRPCDWTDSAIGQLKALPDNGRPVTQWADRDDAFTQVARALRALVCVPVAPPPARTEAVAPQPLQPVAAVAAQKAVHSTVTLARRFTDQDRHDFLSATFEYITRYFQASLTELERANPGITGRTRMTGDDAFTATAFRDGTRIAECRLRRGTTLSPDTIAFSHGHHISDSSYNELLSVEQTPSALGLKALMGHFRSSPATLLTDEAAASYLWGLFIEPLQR
jgi:hypothetical protein